MADIRIKDLATTATSSASDDYLALDGSTNGTRKILATNVANNVTDVIFGTSGPSAKSSIAARAARQGLVFDGTAGATVSVTGPGTNDFSVSAWAAPTSVSTRQALVYSATNGLYVEVGQVSGAVTVGQSGVAATVSTSAVLTAGKTVLITVTKTSGTTTIYINGILSTSIADAKNYSGTINRVGSTDAGSLYFTGAINGTLIYNRALSAAEVVSLYEAGVPAGADYNTASNTSKLTGANSDFSSAGNWTITGATTISGGKLNLSNNDQAYCTPGNISVPVGGKFRVTLTVDSITAGSVQVYTGSIGGWVNIATTAGTFTQEFTFSAATGSNTTFNLKSTGGNAVVDTALYYQIGLLLAPDAAQSGGGLTWYDTSGNAANITLPATGVSWNVPTSGRGLFADGTAAAPSISFASDTDTGFWRREANGVGFAAAGSPSLEFYTAGQIYGDDGTGTIAPKLQLNPSTGAIGLTASGTNKNITLTPSGTGTVVSTNVNFDVTSSLVTAEVYCTAAFAIGRGGSISLGGLIDGSNSSTFAAIAGQKESAVSGATGGYLGLFTRANGAAMGERARILSTGRFLLGTTTDSGALLQIGTNTTANTGGMVFGTDTFLFREAAGTLNVSGTANAFVYAEGTAGASQGFLIKQAGSFVAGMRVAASTSLLLTSGNNTIALTLDSSQRTILAGALRLNNAYVAGAVVGTGYVTIQDSTGTTYRVPVLV